MTTPGSYRTSRIPTDAYTCTDCGALTLDTTAHNTWHNQTDPLRTVARIGPNDHLILTADLNLDDAQRLENLVRKAGLTGRVTVIHPDLNPRIVTTPCPDCDHNSTDHGGPHGCAYRRYKAAICGCHRTTW